jgi:glyoxylase-like metal-dependent hydrolase (beta-lactamase superfamily II)
MNRQRVLLSTAFLLLAAGAWLSTAQPNTVKNIAPGVWFREGDIRNEGHCNNIIIEMKDYLIVVDANFPSGARAALADARKVSSKPVKYVFDTHHHGDHAYGNPVWTQMGAITLAHANVAVEMKAREPKDWLAAAKQRKDVADLKLPTAEPPKQTFDKSPFVLTDGSRRVEFHHFGWAHTKGDGFVYLPAEKILCTGDAVTNGAYNFTGHANIANWPNVLAQARKLDVKTVLPGHGGPGGADLIDGEARFMTELYKAVQSEMARGRKLEEVVTLKGTQPSATSVKLPDSVSKWVGNPLPAQVRDAFVEMREKKPRGDLPL